MVTINDLEEGSESNAEEGEDEAWEEPLAEPMEVEDSDGGAPPPPPRPRPAPSKREEKEKKQEPGDLPEDEEELPLDETDFFAADGEEAEEGEEEDGEKEDEGEGDYTDMDRQADEEKQLELDRLTIEMAPPRPPIVPDNYGQKDVGPVFGVPNDLKLYRAEEVAKCTLRLVTQLKEGGGGKFEAPSSDLDDLKQYLTHFGMSHNTIGLEGRATLPQITWMAVNLAKPDDGKRYTPDTLKRLIFSQLMPENFHKRPLLLSEVGVVRSLSSKEGLLASGLLGDALAEIDGHSADVMMTEEQQLIEDAKEEERERARKQGKEEKKDEGPVVVKQPAGQLMAHAHLMFFLAAQMDLMVRAYPAALHVCDGEEELEKALKQRIQQPNGGDFTTAGKKLLSEHSLPAGCRALYKNQHRGHGNHFEAGDMMKQFMETSALKRTNVEICARLFRDDPVVQEGKTEEELEAIGIGYPDLKPTSLDAWKLQAFAFHVNTNSGQEVDFLKDYVITWQDWGTQRATTITQTERQGVAILPRILCEGPGRYYVLDKGKRWTSCLENPTLVRALRVWEDRAPATLDGLMENMGVLPPRMAYDPTLVKKTEAKKTT